MNAKRFGLYTLLVGITGGCSSIGYGPNSPDYYPELNLSFNPAPDSIVLAEGGLNDGTETSSLMAANPDYNGALVSHERLP
jgi:hypothetical protein